MLSTPLLWIVLPLLMAGILGLFNQKKVLIITLSTLTCLLLALLAWFFPENLKLSIGPLSLTFTEQISLLGRQIAIPVEILSYIGFVFGVSALWNLTSGIIGTATAFHPLSLVIISLLTAAGGVQPFLYAALLIETAVLVSIPLLSPIHTATKPGVLRFLSFQSLAMPLILLAGWLLAGVESLPADSPLSQQIGIVLGLGFGLWLSVFPFHSWLPMVAEFANPMITSFLFFLMPTSILLLGLNFIDRYAWLRDSTQLYDILQIMGILMVLLGGVWTALQKKLKRAFGFAMLSETGFSLLMLGLNTPHHLTYLVLMLPVRAFGYWLWSYSLATMAKHAESLTLDGLRGVMIQKPIISAGLVLAPLSIAGFPLLASFPYKINLFSSLFQAGMSRMIWAFAGNAGLIIFSFRVLITLLDTKEKEGKYPWRITEKMHEALPVALMTLILILFGIFPHIFLSKLPNLLNIFTHLR
jgi:NADH:ubiquinone oxidoreductase subunit 2 (subunit N)